MSDSDVSSPLKQTSKNQVKVYFNPKKAINICIRYEYE